LTYIGHYSLLLNGQGLVENKIFHRVILLEIFLQLLFLCSGLVLLLFHMHLLIFVGYWKGKIIIPNGITLQQKVIISYPVYR